MNERCYDEKCNHYFHIECCGEVCSAQIFFEQFAVFTHHDYFWDGHKFKEREGNWKNIVASMKDETNSEYFVDGLGEKGNV